MKKILTLLFALCVSLAGFAQKRVTSAAPVNHNLEGDTAPENSGFGLKGGVNISNVHGDDTGAYNNIKGKTSYHVGAFAQFSITDNFSVQPEVIYSRQGFNSDGFDTKLDYFNVPLLFSLRVLNNISIQAGPQVGLLLTTKENEKEINKGENYNSFDYGAAAGIEGRVSVVRLGVRYNRSFQDIYKNNPMNMVSTRSATGIQNNVLQVYLGFGF